MTLRCLKDRAHVLLLTETVYYTQNSQLQLAIDFHCIDTLCWIDMLCISIYTPFWKKQTKFLCWAKVLSGIPQGSTLDPLLYDLVFRCEDNIKLHLFADDAKMHCYIKNYVDKDTLQRGIGHFVEWTKQRQVSLNINKCKIMSVHYRRHSNMGVAPNYVLNNILAKKLKKWNI